MAFEDWEFYDRAVIDVRDDTETLANFPLVIDGSRLSEKFWDNVRSDLGDVRASNDANVELPCYVHSYDYVAHKAIIIVKGTLSANAKTTIRIHYGNASATTPGVTSTYGRNNCFNSNIRGYWPDGAGNDVTLNANHFTMVGSPTVGGQLGPIGSSKATAYNGSTQYGYASNSVPTSYPLTMIQYGKLANDSAGHNGLSLFNNGSAVDYHTSLWNGATAGDPFQGSTRSTSTVQQDTTSTNDFAPSTWNQGVYVLTSATSRKAGGNGGNFDATPATTNISPVSLNRIGVGAFQTSGGVSLYCQGDLSFLQLHTVALSDLWIATDWEMLTDQQSFWGDWTPNQSLQGIFVVPETKEVDYTIVHELSTGGGAHGNGFSQPVYSWATKPDAISSVVWKGGRTKGEAMMRYGAQQAVYEKFNLWGASSADLALVPPPARVPIGLLVEKVYGSFDVGTGSLVLRDMCISYADIGIKCATDLNMGNCELVTTERVMFHGCNKAFQGNNIHGLGWRHVSPTIFGCTTFMEYVAGGDLHVDNATLISAAPHTFLKLVNTWLGHGPNVSKFTIREVKVDSGSVNAVMLDMDPGNLYYADIIFEDLHFPGATWTNPAFLVAGHTTLFLDRVKNLQPGMIKVLNSGNTYSPRIVVRDSSIAGSMTTAADLIDSSSTGDCHLVTQGLYYNNDPHVTWTDYDAIVP